MSSGISMNFWILVKEVSISRVLLIIYGNPFIGPLILSKKIKTVKAVARSIVFPKRMFV